MFWPQWYVKVLLKYGWMCVSESFSQNMVAMETVWTFSTVTIESDIHQNKWNHSLIMFLWWIIVETWSIAYFYFPRKQDGCHWNKGNFRRKYWPQMTNLGRSEIYRNILLRTTSMAMHSTLWGQKPQLPSSWIIWGVQRHCIQRQTQCIQRLSLHSETMRPKALCAAKGELAEIGG